MGLLVTTTMLLNTKLLGIPPHPLLTVRERTFTLALIQITMAMASNGAGMIGHMFILKKSRMKMGCQYYPSKILGFIRVETEVEAIVQYGSVDSLEWSRGEKELIVHFCLCKWLWALICDCANISAYSSTVCHSWAMGVQMMNIVHGHPSRRNWRQYFSSLIGAF